MTEENTLDQTASARRLFDECLLAQVGALKVWCVQLTGEKEEARDLSQATLAKAIEYWESFRPGSSMRAWLFVIARNQFYTAMRRRRFYAEWDDDRAERSLTTDGEMTEAEAQLNLEHLLACIGSINTQQALAVIAVGYLGLSYEDTAALLECEVGTIKSRTSRGREKLIALSESIGKITRNDIRRLLGQFNALGDLEDFGQITQAIQDLSSTYGQTKR